MVEDSRSGRTSGRCSKWIGSSAWWRLTMRTFEFVGNDTVNHTCGNLKGDTRRELPLAVEVEQMKRA